MSSEKQQYHLVLGQDDKPAKPTRLEAGDRLLVYTRNGTVCFLKGTTATSGSTGRIFFEEVGKADQHLDDKLYFKCLNSAMHADACNLAKLVAAAAGLGYELEREGEGFYQFKFTSLPV